MGGSEGGVPSVLPEWEALSPRSCPASRCSSWAQSETCQLWKALPCLISLLPWQCWWDYYGSGRLVNLCQLGELLSGQALWVLFLLRPYGAPVQIEMWLVQSLERVSSDSKGINKFPGVPTLEF